RVAPCPRMAAYSGGARAPWSGTGQRRGGEGLGARGAPGELDGGDLAGRGDLEAGGAQDGRDLGEEPLVLGGGDDRVALGGRAGAAGPGAPRGAGRARARGRGGGGGGVGGGGGAVAKGGRGGARGAPPAMGGDRRGQVAPGGRERDDVVVLELDRARRDDPD